MYFFLFEKPDIFIYLLSPKKHEYRKTILILFRSKYNTMLAQYNTFNQRMQSIFKRICSLRYPILNLVNTPFL